MAERFRDPSRVSVAIGSFLVDDPFSKYTDLDQSLHAALRRRLLKIERIDLAERFHPTQLLREFELARAGFVPSVMAQLTAPVSDVLIVGDVEPTANQDLDKRDSQLAYRIRVVSQPDCSMHSTSSSSCQNPIQTAPPIELPTPCNSR